MSKLYDDTTERLVLYAMLERPSLCKYFLPKLQPQIFGGECQREIFERMLFLNQQGHELPTPGVMAQDPGLSNEAQITIKSTPKDRVKVSRLSKADCRSMLSTIQYYYKVRTLYESQKVVAEKLSSKKHQDINEVIATIQQGISEAQAFDDPTSNYKIIGKGGNITDAYLDEAFGIQKTKVLKTGFSAIDDRATLSLGNLVLMTAQKGHGKSVLAKSLAWSHWNQTQNVMVVNLEMEADEYLGRLFAETTPYNHDTLRRGYNHLRVKNRKNKKTGKIRRGMSAEKQNEELLAELKRAKRRADGIGAIDDCRLVINTISNPNYTPQMLHAELKHQGFHVVIIDYINLFKNTHRELWQSIYAHTKYLKMMAKDLGILLYVLGQLNEEGRAKYARAAEEDADVWWMWEVVPGQPMVPFFHGKARHYKPFVFNLVFDGANASYYDPIEIQDNEKEMARIRRQSEAYANELLEARERIQKDKDKLASSKKKSGPKSQRGKPKNNAPDEGDK